MKKYLASFLTVALVATTGFAQTADEHAKAKKGAAIGAAAGAIVGAVIGNNKGHGSTKRGAIAGVLAGGAAGAIVGAMMDKQERELRQIQGVNVERTAPDELKVTVGNDVLFDTGSSNLRAASKASIREMADVFDKYPNTTISVQGHTDSVGTNSNNQRLSERRANSVASYLQTVGVTGSRVETTGYGESQPRSSNSTRSGRQSNRRVEIHIRANAA